MTSRNVPRGRTQRRSRFWPVVALLSVTAVVCLTLAAHGYSAYHAAPGKPTVMPLGDLVGFLVGGLLVVTVSLVVLGRVRGQRG